MHPNTKSHDTITNNYMTYVIPRQVSHPRRDLYIEQPSLPTATRRGILRARSRIFDSAAVMGNYERMFVGSFLAALPGGVVPFVYILGVMELIAALLLLANSFGAEFLPSRKKTFLKLSLFVTPTAFILLSFGLNIIINYPGATQLVIYASFTVQMFVDVEYDEKRELKAHRAESPAPAQA